MGAKIDQKSIRKWNPRRDACFGDRRTPQGAPRRPQDGPETLQDAARSSQDAPKMPPRRPKTHPRRPKTTPRGAQDGPRRPQDSGTKGSQKRSEAQSPPDLDFGAFRGGFGSFFGRILEGFKVDFGRFRGKTKILFLLYASGALSRPKPPKTTRCPRKLKPKQDRRRQTQTDTKTTLGPRKLKQH